jgi:type I restriction enzyme S subunit
LSQPTSNVVETSLSVLDAMPLPKGWRYVRLNEITRIFAGSAAPQDPKYFSDTGVPFVRVSDLGVSKRNSCLTEIRDKVSEEAIHNLPLVFANAGTILFPKSGAAIGTNNRAILGTDAYIVSHLMAIEPSEQVDVHWLYWALCQIDMRRYSDNDAYPSLKQSVVCSIKIPFPPYDEQKRIVAIIGEQMAAVERARVAAEEQLKAAKDLPAAYLRDVFDSSEARQWARKRVGDVALIVQNGIYKAAEHYGHGHPFLRMYNVENNSWTLNLDRLALVNLEGKEEQTFALKRGDLLISRVNSFELVGKCAWVSPDAEGFVFENMLIRVQLDSSVNSLFVAQQMATDAVRKQVETVAKRAIGQASINSADLRAIEIALPSLDVQERMANELSARTVEAEQTTKALQDQLNSINKLPAALLRQAFSGKL